MGFVLTGCNSGQLTTIQSPSIEQEDLDRLEKITDSDKPQFDDIDTSVDPEQPQTEEEIEAEKQQNISDCVSTIKNTWGETWDFLIDIKKLEEACQNVQNPYALQCVESFAANIPLYQRVKTIGNSGWKLIRGKIGPTITACSQMHTPLGVSCVQELFESRRPVLSSAIEDCAWSWE